MIDVTIMGMRDDVPVGKNFSNRTEARNKQAKLSASTTLVTAN